MKEVIYYQVDKNTIDIVVKINEKNITTRRLLVKEDKSEHHKKITYPTFYSRKITDKDKIINRSQLIKRLEKKDIKKYIPLENILPLQLTIKPVQKLLF